LDFDISRKKINVFKIGNQYCFKEYFSDREIFKELSEYYNKKKYRFQCGTASERDKIIKNPWKAGFNTNLIEDMSEYSVKIDRFKKEAYILKNSIE